jgi:sulfopyruvate decarboxylase subunit alpha
MSHTGAIGETKHWAIPHDQTMEPVLKALRIPYHIVQTNDEIKEMIQRSYQHIVTSTYHVALVMSGETREWSMQ